MRKSLWFCMLRGREVWFVCLEAEMSLCAMRPTSSDAKLMLLGGSGRDRVDRCVLPCQRPFVAC